MQQPVVAFGLALASLIWLGAIAMLAQERASLEEESVKDAQNMSAIVEQTVLETVRALDNTLKFLRWVEKHDNYQTDWPLVLSEARTVDDEAVQMSVTDSKGAMISSSVDLFPAKPVDLSDRSHFKAQAVSNADELVIGDVVLGRASGKLTVQFSRKRLDEEGRFLGIVVASLPANHFDAHFAKLDLGPGGGLALVGDDGKIRAGNGRFRAEIGKSMSGIDVSAMDGVASVRRIEGYPLTVIARVPGIEASLEWRWRRTQFLSLATIGSLLALIVALGMAYRRDRYECNIVNLSRHDALTGLPNRAYLMLRLEEAAARSPLPETLALHLVDLDGFKGVNDTHGHAIGDELLAIVAERIAGELGPRDMAARLGGDEFAVLQTIDNFEVDSRDFARRVCRAMTRPFSTSRAYISIGASIGVARGGRDGATALELMKSADLALYAAKKDQRGEYRTFDPSLADAARSRLRIENGLRTALAKAQFHVAYQPICSVATRETIGYEALLRWRLEGGDNVPPSDFIPVAEEIGVIVEIGAWALRRACADIAAGPSHIKISVNASPVQFEAGDFARAVREALDETGLPAKRLHIEITESLLMKDKARVLDQLREIRELGVSVSIDDFGTGYSCLSYLEIYPIDTLKIDQQFTRKIGVREDAVKTLRAIIDLAASFGMTTIAEGVETSEQLEALRELGCEQAQGYLLGRPGPLPERSPEQARMFKADAA